jgi:aldose 1-epimerase
VALTPNHLPEPHALHGLGWHQAWELTESGPDFARLVHTHDGKTEWPWPYRSEQHIRLDHQGLEMSITITNLADEPAPAGLGLHPYFRRSGETVVRFTAEALLVCEPGLLPTGELAPADTLAAWSDGAALPAATVDHCHTGWNGQAIITDARGEVLLTASNAGYLHVYAPEDGSALCLEPVSHRPDARNTCPGDMSVLAPGETLSLSMRITA